ncbi:MAG: FG-GAP repeat domain-containing protein, partial [Ilumatobacter sp.]
MSVIGAVIAPVDLEGAGLRLINPAGADGVVLYENQFGHKFPFTPGNSTVLRADADYVHVATGDIDNDGDGDAVAARNNGQITLFRGAGDGSIAQTVDLTFDSAGQTHQLELVDLNVDGDLDVVVLQSRGGFTEVRTLINTGGGLFPGTPSVYWGEVPDAGRDMAIADIDRDGDPDIVVASVLAGGHQVLVNNGGTVGSEVELTTPVGGPTSVDLGDVDDDGYADIVFGQENGDSVAFLNLPANGADFTGSIAVSISGAPATTADDVQLADVDADGLLDLVTASAADGFVEVAYGDGTAAFDGGLSTVVVGGDFSEITAFELDVDRGLEIVVWDQSLGAIVTSQNPALVSEAGNQVRSIVVANPVDPITQAAVVYEDFAEVGPNELDVWLTNNGGVNWYRVDERETFTFPTVGNELAFRTEFADDRLFDFGNSPRQSLGTLTVEYFAQIAATPTVDVTLTVTPDLADSGPSAVPLDALAPEVLQEASDDGVDSDIAALPLSSIDLLPSDDPNIQASPLSSIPLSSIPLSSLPLSSIPLSDVPIDAPGGWDGVLERARATGETELIGAPLQNVTFADVAELSEVQALPLSSIDLAATPLSSIPLSSIALGATPLSSIDIGPFPEAWCDLLESPDFGFDCIADFGISAGDTETDVNIVDLAVQGAPLSSIPLSSVPLSSLPLSSLPLSSIPLSSVELGATPLSSVPLSSIPLSSIELQASPLSSIPLSSVPLSSVPLSSVPLSSLDLAGTPLSSVPLSSVDIAGSPLSSIPLSSLDLATLPLSSIPLSSVPLSSLPLSSLPLSSVFVSGVPLSSLPLSSVDIAGSPLSSIPLSSVDIAGSPLSSVPLSSLPLSSVPLSSVPLSSVDIAGSPLSSVPLSSVDIAGSPLSSVPLSSIPLSSIGDVVDCNLIDCDDERNTLFQAVLNNAIQPDAELGDLEGAFGGTRHDDLASAITGVDREAYEQAVRDALDAGSASTLAELLAQGRGDDLVLGDLPSDLVELASTPFLVLLAGLAGFDYSALGSLLAQVTLGGDLVDFTDVVDVDDATLGELLSDPDQNPPTGSFFDQVVLNDIADAFTGLRMSDLAAIFGVNEAQLAQDLNGITGTLSDVSDFDDLTLGELLVYGGATLDDLFAALALANPPVLDAIVLGELLVGLLAVTDYPWDIVDFGAEDLVEFDDTSSNVEYSALVQTADAPGETVELRVTLPPGSPYVPGSTTFPGAGDADPEIQGTDLVWTFEVNGAATADLVTFEARPPLNLATHPAEATARLLDS